MVDRTITTDLIGRDRSLSSSMEGAGRKASKLGSVLGKVGHVMKMGVAGGAAVAAVGVAALGKWVIDGVKSAQSYQVILAKTAAVLKSTGNGAGTSVGAVKDLAAELETMSGVDEELIINSQNVLLTFTNIKNVGKNRIFDMATKSALDMSVALGSDLQGASIQLGKALNDPIKGISALSKVGVSFTEDQKKVIASLVKTGDTAGAQKVILAELNKEFGGQAKAAGATFEGSMARVQDVIGDTGREVGQALLPKLTDLANWLTDKLPVAVQDFKDGWKGIGDGQNINGLASALHDLSTQLASFNKQAGEANGNGIVRFVKWGVNALTTFIESFRVLGANWSLIKTRIEQWNLQIQISFQKMVNGIVSAGGKLPGPMGRHFRKIRADGIAALADLQGKMNGVNTRRARAELTIAEVELKRLGRQRPTPKVRADISSAQANIARIRVKLHQIRDENVNIYLNEIYREAHSPHEPGRIGHRAGGGPVRGKQPYITGEHGRELFVPETNGTIMTAGETRAIMSSVRRSGSARPTGYAGAGGGDVYYISVSGVGDRALGDAVVTALERRPAGSKKIPARSVAAH